jgi:plastocyanin
VFISGQRPSGFINGHRQSFYGWATLLKNRRMYLKTCDMKRTLLMVCLAILASFLIVVSCSKGGSGYSSNNNGNNPPPTGNANSASVTIANMSFGGDLTVKAGTTVTWTNNDYMTHTVTADGGTFNSGDMGYGATFSHTFNTAGTYAYHCKYHSGMTASIVVN